MTEDHRFLRDRVVAGTKLAVSTGAAIALGPAIPALLNEADKRASSRMAGRIEAALREVQSDVDALREMANRTPDRYRLLALLASPPALLSDDVLDSLARGVVRSLLAGADGKDELRVMLLRRVAAMERVHLETLRGFSRVGELIARAEGAGLNPGNATPRRLLRHGVSSPEAAEMALNDLVGWGLLSRWTLADEVVEAKRMHRLLTRNGKGVLQLIDGYGPAGRRDEDAQSHGGGPR